MDYQSICRSCGRRFRADVGEGEVEKLKASLRFLGWEVTPEEVQSVARAATILAAMASLLAIAALLFFLGFSLLWFIFLGFPAILYFYLRKYPVFKAESEKKKATGQMPESMSYLIMSLRISPNLERGVEFAAKHSHGLLRGKLSDIIAGVRSGKGDTETGLLLLADEFGKWDEIRRCVQLVLASTSERTEDRRQETLDKATEVLLGGIAVRAEREARAMNTPVMVVFTFGVILPLVFVAIIPFMSLMGLRIGESSVAIMYTVGLPLFLYLLVNFISSSRPVSVPPPQVPAERGVKRAVALAVAASVLLLVPLVFGKRYLGALEYVPLLWASAVGTGIFLLVSGMKTKKLRKRTKEIEKGFAETLHQLGVILSEGRPLEDAMLRTDSQFLKSAAGNIQRLNTNLRSALFDESFGSLREVYSDTIRGVADILISISDKGSEAMAKVAFRMSEHINNLRKTEFEIERALGGVVSSMKIIAMVVAPLVGGMISSMSIVLADTMEKSQGANMGFGGKAAPMDPGLITLIIGVYAIESAAILVMFGTELMQGNDKVMKRYNVGVALIIAVFVFTVCAWAANGVFGGIS